MGTAARDAILTPQHERALGQLIAQQFGIDMRVIEIPGLIGRLQAIGEHIARSLPPNEYRFQFLLIDSPETTAFTIPGGRIYVSRKLIALTRNEDELAGVLAHEMGHAITRQFAMDWTRRFKRVLNITALGDDDDVIDRYHQVLDSYARNSEAFNADRSDREQQIADQVSLYALARAGYTPARFAEFMDRLMETKGRKGSWLGDLFGTTRPDWRRIRELVKTTALPDTCVAGAPPTRENYDRWKAEVLGYSGLGKQEALRGVVAKKVLDPGLRGEIEHLRFSPNGKLILAQDDASVFVLSREPFRTLFRIPALNANPAQFTPDSAGVVFYDRGLRVEHWDVAEQKRISANEVYVARKCLQSKLSPDGALLACVRSAEANLFPLELELIDVASGEPVLAKTGFAGNVDRSSTAAMQVLMVMVGNELVNMDFSPDGKYFLASSDYSRLGFDLAVRKEIPVTGRVKTLIQNHFVFLPEGRLIAWSDDVGEKAEVVRFPSGEAVSADLPTGGRTLTAPGHGDYVIVRPLVKAPVGIMDLKAKKIEIGSRTDAIDIYDGIFVNERANGEIGMYAGAGQPPLATALLPRAPLGWLRAAVVSDDAALVAVSTRSRGAVWNLTTGERLFHVRPFDGAYFDGDAIFADFEPADRWRSSRKEGQSWKDLRRSEAEKPGKSVGRFDLAARQIVPTGTAFLKRTLAQQVGAYLISRTPDSDDEPSKNLTFEVRDIRSGHVLWARHYGSDVPALYATPESSQALVTVSQLWENYAAQALREDAALKRRVDALANKEGWYLVEVLDMNTGKAMARFPVDTGFGSFHITEGFATADQVILTDNHDRILVYSLAGKRLGRVIGAKPQVSKDRTLLCVQREPDRLAIYDLSTMHEREQFTFASRVSYAAFTGSGARLAALTEDQTFYILDPSGDGAAGK